MTLDTNTYACPTQTAAALAERAGLSTTQRATISRTAAEMVERLRSEARPGLMETFLAEYGLSTDEGVALMCLAEALLRVPDAATIDALIEDKIAPSDWARHLGQSTSTLVNASTWALMLTGRVLDDTAPGPIGHLREAVRRLGEPVIRKAVSRAMKEMGRQFVLGEDIDQAMARAAAMEARGYSYSYDMLGEAALTQADAARYFDGYHNALGAIARASRTDDVRTNPGLSVKLSALHPRYERAQSQRVLTELVPRLKSLARAAQDARVGMNIDAEEADRLSLSLEVVDALLSDPELAGWDGLGVVVQAYGQRAGDVIDHLYARASTRRIMVRLVKGAYWDTEIKRAQVMGLDGFPVFSRKAETDVSYISCARKLLDYADRLYPQFATHNAHTIASILHMAEGQSFEFQRLHGMGEALHDMVRQDHATACRVYAPVGAHKDLLAYLVRRLLENGANSSFVNQIVDTSVPPETVAADPFDALTQHSARPRKGTGIFAPARRNARGFDLAHVPTLAAIDLARAPFRDAQWVAEPLTVRECPVTERHVTNPAAADDVVGRAAFAQDEAAAHIMADAAPWSALADTRRAVLERAADLFESHFGEIFALLAREAGKTLPDAVAELREAVDFLRYYASEAQDTPPQGTFLCISPWNFPLAIFTGQLAAALAAGNAVVAKPAEQTPLIAGLAVRLLHDAGVPRAALQFVPGDGKLGAALTRAAPDGVAFTGSTATARAIQRSLARHARPGIPLIAETGGLNAMIIDSTALPEQAVRAVIESAFQSAGQRCSALRCLYVQSDIAEAFLEMLRGAMDELCMGNPWDLNTDIGPLIDATAQAQILTYLDSAADAGRLLHQTPAPEVSGLHVPPSLVAVDGIGALAGEVFGPVLHVATFDAPALDSVINEINGTGYGLTFGLQTRIDARIEHVARTVDVGNVYVNRNQIGAIVGSQPFGGHGLSGTGPKAGGPHYVRRFSARPPARPVAGWSGPATLPDIPHQPRALTAETQMPGPTGEDNTLYLRPKAPLLCAGPGGAAAAQQADIVSELGGVAVQTKGGFAADDLTDGPAYGGVLWWGDADFARALAQALAAREGPIIPLICGRPDRTDVMHEHHLCVDTTAAGGNADLLSTHS